MYPCLLQILFRQSLQVGDFAFAVLQWRVKRAKQPTCGTLSAKIDNTCVYGACFLLFCAKTIGCARVESLSFFKHGRGKIGTIYRVGICLCFQAKTASAIVHGFADLPLQKISAIELNARSIGDDLHRYACFLRARLCSHIAF